MDRSLPSHQTVILIAVATIVGVHHLAWCEVRNASGREGITRPRNCSDR
jgi:hypothetical protein